MTVISFIAIIFGTIFHPTILIIVTALTVCICLKFNISVWWPVKPVELGGCLICCIRWKLLKTVVRCFKKHLSSWQCERCHSTSTCPAGLSLYTVMKTPPYLCLPRSKPVRLYIPGACLSKAFDCCQSKNCDCVNIAYIMYCCLLTGLNLFLHLREPITQAVGVKNQQPSGSPTLSLNRYTTLPC